MSNVSKWLLDETLTEAGTLSAVGMEKRSSKGGGGRTLEAMANLEIPQGYSVCDFSCLLTENPDTLYVKVVGIP